MRIHRRHLSRFALGAFLTAAGTVAAIAGCAETTPIAGDNVLGAAEQELGQGGHCHPDPVEENAALLVHEGRNTFRYDTFGDQAFWGGQMRLHEAIAGAANGGVGPGLSPAAALGLGLKVDSDALGQALRDQIAAGQVDLNDPAVTVALIRLGAVVGLRGFFDNGTLESIGITCALCHSTVNDSLAPGIGGRRDGWANRDLNVGAIVALSPGLQVLADMLQTDVATTRMVLLAWGPGKYDAQLVLDGKGFRPDGKTAATLIPPAFGLAGVNLHTSTGWGSVPYWNAFVANTQMHGQGTFYDPRLDDAEKFPLAVANNLGHIRQPNPQSDLITSKLPALHVFQLAIPIPEPSPDSFDAQAAARGEKLFNGKAKCARCHVPPIFTEPGWNMHTPEEIGIDDFQANRSPDERYRTAPLRGLFTHQKGGFYHDGRFATLEEVIEHYDSVFSLGLSPGQTNDLVEYLKSL